MEPDDNISDRAAQVARMLHAAARTERAPLRLRAEVDDLGRQAAQRRPSSSRRLVAAPLRIAAATATSCAALVVVLVLLLGGGAAEPSLAAAAALATKGPTAPAPVPDPRAPAQLTARVGELHFPNWEQYEGWHSSGKRIDKLGDRSVTTVFYARDGKQIAYSIISQPALRQPATHGEPYATLHQHGRTVVVWTEDDHTCVLSAAGITASQLWRLAASSRSAQPGS